MARYLYGVNYRQMDLRFALTEAAENRSTLSVEKILLYCYHYDPQAGAYVLFASNVMKAGGVLTILAIAFFLRRMIQEERKRTARWKEGIA